MHNTAAPQNGTPLLYLRQSRFLGFDKLHSCVQSRIADLEAEEAGVIATRSTKLLHAFACPGAPSPDRSMPFESLEQAKKQGYLRRHGCLDSE